MSSKLEAKFRSVTPAEIAHYREFGWAKLEKFVPTDTVNVLLAVAKSRMGERGDKNAPPESFTYFNSLQMFGTNDALLGPVIRHVGRAARALSARKAPVGIRYLRDNFAVKLPSKDKRKHGGAGVTDWHQDYAAQMVDRSGGMAFWFALTDLAPENGTMTFLNGSHRYGAMGHYRGYRDGDLLSSYPELRDTCSPSEPMSYAAGDVTVHSDLCVHSAGLNLSDTPRWTYIIMVNPADARWTGGPSDAYDIAGLGFLEELDEKRFPIIG